MKALVKTQKGLGFLEICDVPEPSPGPGEVLIEVKACGIYIQGVRRDLQPFDQLH